MNEQPNLPGFSLRDLDEVSQDPIILTVVGHTNQGKTSIVRTFTRDAVFGEVDDEPGVTRDVTAKRIHMFGRTLIRIFDTPGLESIDAAVEEFGGDVSVDQALEFFSQHEEFATEAAVLQQVRKSHVILYVVDVTNFPSDKYQQEFRLLARSNVPVIPLLNFLKSEKNYRSDWEEMFRGTQNHVYTPYDAHDRVPEYEWQLYRRISALLVRPAHSAFLEQWIKFNEKHEAELMEESAAAITGLLMDATLLVVSQRGVSPKERKQIQVTLAERFKTSLAEREHQTHVELAEIYRFSEDIIESGSQNDDSEPIWRRDLFGPAVNRHFGIGAASGMLTGAAAGGAIDAAVGGASFLLGTLLGGATGLILGVLAGGMFNSRYDSETETVSISVNQPMLTVLLGRAAMFFLDVRRRGHAKLDPTRISDKPQKLDKTLSEQLLGELSRLQREAAGSLPQLSQIGQFGGLFKPVRQQLPERQAQLTEITRKILEAAVEQQPRPKA